MPELDLDLWGSLDALAPSSESMGLWMYEQLLRPSEMSTSSAVTSVILLVRTIICRWKMFVKAWLPGWWAIIPFYNIYLWFKMAGMSGWWVLSLLIAPVFLVAFIVSFFKVSKRFGKSGWFGLGLWFLNPIFIGILAFGKAQYSAK